MLGLGKIGLALSIIAQFQSVVAGRSKCVGETVSTSSGRVQGHASKWQPEVSEYLGIPYAQTPKRFEAAMPLRGQRFKSIKGDTYGASCPANLATANASDTSGAGKLLLVLAQSGEKLSEDCLFLNVWTKPQSGEKKKAVMIWIHGGGFNSGSASSPVYNGARLANDQDVVVVSMNYRLNIFGFPGAPGIPAQNLGLRDQRLAVEWARDNVAAFGGDPNRMILFGESAGAASVDLYSYAYRRDPIVKGFIAQSGAASNRGGGIDAVQKAWYEASEKIGCGGAAAGNQTVECMRKKTTQEILDSIRPEGAVLALGSSGFTPVADGKIVFSDYEDRRSRGQFIKAPMLIGNNDNEGGIYIVIAEAGGLGGALNRNATLAAVNTQFTCLSKSAVNGRINAGVPAWRYRYFGDYDNQDIGVEGAWHGAELAMVFGTTEFTSKEANSPEQDRLMKSMMHAWASFAKSPTKGLQRLGWPVYKDNGPTLVRLGHENAPAPDFSLNGPYDVTCGNSTARR